MWALLAAGAVIALFCPRAEADAHAEARAYFDQANRAVESAARATGPKRRALLEEARSLYLKSLEGARNRNVVFNLAVTYAELEAYDDAFSFFDEYLRFDDLSEAEHRDAEARLGAVARKVVVVEASTTPPGATVRVGRKDTAPRGATPLRFAVAPGTHRVLLSLPGYGERTATISGGAGETVRLEETLEASPVTVTFSGTAEGQLFVDGVDLGAARRTDLLPGKHVARLGAAGVETAFDVAVGAVDLEVALARPAEPVAAPPPPASMGAVDSSGGGSSPGAPSLAPWPLVAWLGTAAAGGTAIVLSAVALGANGDYEDAPSPGRADAVDDANLRADVFWAVTAGFAITALTLTLLDGDDDDGTDDGGADNRGAGAVAFSAAPLDGGAVLSARVTLP